MALELKQNLKMTQTLKMTPQLQQAIKLLQLSRMELVDLVRQEMEENPVLEEGAEGAQETAERTSSEGVGTESLDEVRPPDMAMEGVETEQPIPQNQTGELQEIKADSSAINEIDWENYLDQYSSSGTSTPAVRGTSDEMPSIESTLTTKTSLTDHLLWQLRMSGLNDGEDRVGQMIIGNLDQNGYFSEPPLEEIANEAGVPLESAERVLRFIQLFDPVGIAARDLKECLLIQARFAEEDDRIVLGIIEKHLPNLERRNYPAIAKDLNEPLEEIYEAVKVISSFDPKPGRVYTEEEPVYITPDVYVYKLGDQYFVVPNDDGLPKLKVSNFYRNALSGNNTQERQYVQDKLRSAQWLIRSIQQRQRTIIRVTESIVKFQRDFFDRGVGFLKPMILRDVAEDIQMHESTVSRVTTNKYVHTPQGIFELKYFFNSAISRTEGDDIASESVKNKIKEIVEAEDLRKPFSDQRLVELLQDQQIDIARRTVAKYREQLGIMSSSKRKRVF